MIFFLFKKPQTFTFTRNLTRLISNSKKKDENVKNNLVEHKDVIIEDENMKIIERKTHTKQIWNSNDFRLARFIDKQKIINENFAIDLISDVPAKPCKERIVSCNGGDLSLGHPRVFINLDQPGNHTCGYCGLRFYLHYNQH